MALGSREEDTPICRSATATVEPRPEAHSFDPAMGVCAKPSTRYVLDARMRRALEATAEQPKEACLIFTS